VTPKSEGNLDLYPAGEFMSCNGPNEGLPEWIQQERDVSKEDLVIWHAFGLHHAARPEDFPVQNVVNCGFKLMPFGFFARNPVIDMAEPDHTSHGMSCHMNASGAGSTADDQIVSGGGGGR
jgi:primary-amine oxidase